MLRLEDNRHTHQSSQLKNNYPFPWNSVVVDLAYVIRKAFVHTSILEIGWQMEYPAKIEI